MHSTKVHKVIALIISFFYLVGFWHRGDKPTARELRIKAFYSIYYPLFAISLVVGMIATENMDKMVLLAGPSIDIAVLSLKLWILIWKQKEIDDLMNRVCVFPIRNDYEYAMFQGKLKGFAKFVVGFVIALMVGGSLESVVIPFLGSEKALFLPIWFPLNWKNNEIAFWIATLFLFTESLLSVAATFFSIIVWYLLLVCSLRYEVLGSELKRMGRINEVTIEHVSKRRMHHIFYNDLKASIDDHIHLRELTDELGSYFSKIFFIQFGTSGLCICGSTYCLAFDFGDNLFERLVLAIIFFYATSESFMITYYGNEIKLSSNDLSYSLFESDWIEQPQSTKKCIIIFGEYLKKPLELVVGKLYPLTLETFTRITNSAYSMFNILKNFKD